MMDPILRRDLTVRSRSMRIPVLIAAVAALLFAVGILGTFGIVSQMRAGLTGDYAGVLDVYMITVLTEALLILLICPSLTAGNIALERETRTLDLVMTTGMSPSTILRGRLLSSFVTVLMVILCALPAMMIPLVFGGVSIQRMLLLEAALLPLALLMLSLGLFAGSLAKGAAQASAFAYGMTFLLGAGPVLLPLLLRPFSAPGKNVSAYLTVLDPLTAAASLLLRQTGNGQLIPELFASLGLAADSAYLRYLPLLSILAQLLLGGCFLALSALNLAPKRQRKALPGS